MVKCCEATRNKMSVAGFGKADINKSLICWCAEHGVDFRSKVFGPGRWLTLEELNSTQSL
jgi:hypothetical protein